MSDAAFELLVAEIKSIMGEARKTVARSVNKTVLVTYWHIGRVIVEHEQKGSLKAQYGTRLLPALSKRLTTELGRGYSRSNLQNMRLLYNIYPEICQIESGKLTWSHYIEITSVDDSDARSFYEHECANARWSVEELKRQIGTSLYERILLSDGKPNKEKALALAREGAILERPEDVLKQPYVFEFIGVREEKPMLESELEAKLIRHLEDFLLELARGFMYVGSQQRIPIGNNYYRVDMVPHAPVFMVDMSRGEN